MTDNEFQAAVDKAVAEDRAQRQKDVAESMGKAFKLGFEWGYQNAVDESYENWKQS